MRVLFDTNVLVSAFATEGLCARLLLRANRREFELFMPPVIREEFEKASEAKIGLTAEEIRAALLLLEEIAKPGDSAKCDIRFSKVCRDESDQAVLEAALACRAEIIVTGDRDLLDLGEFRHIRMLTPREFELLFE
ncbi:MAG: putative toxin-antitoxin system toxin component, PIN family [Candidatus Aminicenantales bacterium]